MRNFVVAAVLVVLAFVLGVSIFTYLATSQLSSICSTTTTPSVSTSIAPSSTATNPTSYSIEIVNAYPHDPGAYTEGLIYFDGFIYESTGLNGKSSLRKVDLTSGHVMQEYSLPSQYFGEGITSVNDTIIQLTWQNRIGFVYDQSMLAPIGNFTLLTDGWGLTFDGAQLIMSDGSSNLYFLNATTFQKTGQVYVHDGDLPVFNINELEYVKGEVYANIWHTNKIAVINPQDGQVKAWIDLSGLPAPTPNGDNVLNGIAYDSANDRLFVTGKQWSSLYQISLNDVS